MSKVGIFVAGLAFGDEAKGATVDKLCRSLPVDVIVRYNGGSQAAHNVVTPEGVHHTFSQFGAGMMANSRVRTHLSRFMLVDPLAFVREGIALSEKTPHVWERTTVDKRCVVITPLHSQLNRLREQERGSNRHGSCGRGVGVAREFSLEHDDAVPLAGDLKGFNSTFYGKMYHLWSLMSKETYELAENLEIPKKNIITADDVYRMYNKVVFPSRIVDTLDPAECMVFEGAQGVLLDETHGTAPHNTWTDTTFNNAETIARELQIDETCRIGCLRSYYTRHGAGPFPTEDPELTELLPEPHNGTGIYQGSFRVGHFDIDLAKKASDIIGGVDSLSISHLDRVPNCIDRADREFLGHLESELGMKIGMEAYGPTADHRLVRGNLKYFIKNTNIFSNSLKLRIMV